MRIKTSMATRTIQLIFKNCRTIHVNKLAEQSNVNSTNVSPKSDGGDDLSCERPDRHTINVNSFLLKQRESG